MAFQLLISYLTTVQTKIILSFRFRPFHRQFNGFISYIGQAYRSSSVEGPYRISNCCPLSCSGKNSCFMVTSDILNVLNLVVTCFKSIIFYLKQGEGIVSVPFTSVSKETLSNLLDKFNDPAGPYHSDGKMAETKLL